MDLESIENRFKDLKKRSVDVAIQIRKIAEREAKDESLVGKPKIYSMEDTNEMGTRPVDSSERRRLKLMNYSMREYEEWDKKQKGKEVKRGGANVQELAKYSYEKDLSRSKQNNGNRVVKISTDAKTNRLQVKDDEKLVNKLANDLKKTTRERFLARKKEMEKADARATPGGYINEKNKQFNLKLDRQMKETER